MGRPVKKEVDEWRDRFDPKDTEEGLLSRLELHDGAWAINIKKVLYVFPTETTREQAEKALKLAWNLFKTRLN